MSEHEEKAQERVEDLDVPDADSDDVKGGLLPAVQASREARRPSQAPPDKGQIEIQSWSY